MSKGLSAYLLYTLMAVLVICLYLGNFTGMQKLQWKIDDLMYKFRNGSTSVPDIALINIDDKSLESRGDWPWSYDVLADLVAVCNTAEPRTMLINLDLSARTGEDTLGNTKILANQVSWSKNLVLTYDIALADYSHQRLSKPKYLFPSAVNVDSDLGILEEDQALNVRKPFLPSDLVCEVADGLGFSYLENAPDGKVRWVPIVANYEGFYYPSASLLAAAMQLGMKAEDIKIEGGKEVIIGGSYNIPTDENGRTYINYVSPKTSFSTYSASDLLDEKINLSNLKGRLIIISLTSTGQGYAFNTPVMKKMPQPQLLANVIENMLHSNYVKQVNLAGPVNILIMLGFGLFCAFILPQVGIVYRMIILSVFLIILANLNYILFNSDNILPRTLYFALEIILLMIASPLIEEAKSRKNEGEKFSLASLFSFAKKDPEEKQKIKKAPVREIKSSGDDPEFQATELLPQQHFAPITTGNVSGASQSVSMAPTKALGPTPPPPPFDPDQPLGVTAPERMNISGNNYPMQTDSGNIIPAPIDSSFGQGSSGAIVSPTPSGSIPVQANQTPPPDLSATPKPPVLGSTDGLGHLGRYKIVGSLGKGAMGTVYKGIDPAINRPVALKTIRLDFVADENELNELRDRLFREAQAAGKLSHPNIVTIYDVGSEGSLQYIAMEYLEGQVLEELIKKKVQFSYKIIANIIVQICDAMDYAHNQGIVHRDIKPANIMVLKDYSVKVMDFGIARVDSSSMTKTGIAMGTPNYISPELLQGHGVDKRCDIFSLGVVIYEMLTGRRPFKGENMTALIYSIIHENPQPPSAINPNVPVIFDHIVNNALKKNPNERYQKATDIRKSLADFVGAFSSAR